MAKTFAHEQQSEQNELTLMKVKMLDSVNSPIQDYVHPDYHTQPTYEMTLGFKLFTVLMKVLWNYWKCKCPALQMP